MYSNNGSRIGSIDLIRGFSIIAVVLFHLNSTLPLNQSALGLVITPFAHKLLFWSGYYGVMIFFVVSGFLITIGSIKKWGSLQHVQIDEFYLRRFSRIMPCLLLLLCVLSLLHCLGIEGFVIDPDKTSLPRAVFAALTFHVNYLESQVGYLPASWDVLWSLSIEETFYLAFPFLCRFLKKESYFIAVMLLLIILGPPARVFFSTNEIWMDHGYLSCMDGIAIGCLAALFASKLRFTDASLKIMMRLGLILSMFIFIFRSEVFTLGITPLGLNITILDVGIGLILMACYGKSLKSTNQGTWKTALFRWFGQHSYEVYLIHMFFIVILAQVFELTHQSLDTIPLWYFLVLVLTGFSSHLLSKYYSEPMNKAIRSRHSQSSAVMAPQ